jgi:hypothetical protein
LLGAAPKPAGDRTQKGIGRYCSKTGSAVQSYQWCQLLFLSERRLFMSYIKDKNFCAWISAGKKSL